MFSGLFVGFLVATAAVQGPHWLNDEDVPSDDRIADLRDQAVSGDADDLYSLGVALLDSAGADVPNGSATEPRLVEARQLFERAAEEDHAEAYNALSMMYQIGLGVDRDELRAMELRLIAAEKGSLAANFVMWQIFDRGAGVAVDEFRAVEYLRRVAESPSENEIVAVAQYELASHYLGGAGVERDLETAFQWLTRAAERGNTEAELELAASFALGRGVEENDPMARAVYQRVADRFDGGFPRAMRALGAMYYYGEGGTQDQALGLAYLRIATAVGDENAQLVIEQLEQETPEAMRNRATSLADEWIAEHRAEIEALPSMTWSN